MASLSPEEELVLATVRRFVDGEVRPVVQELEHTNEYPGELIDRMNELGPPRWRAPSPAAARTNGR
jgi:alkylation response protein AidB-like acyl-CoA dehydrogenase